MRTSLFAVSLLAGFVTWTSCRTGPSSSPDQDALPEVVSATPEEERAAHGARLYEAHCEVCHGTWGEADGPASPFLFPAARDFTSGAFRLVSTANGAPTHDDLVRTLARGVPGSAMPSWSWLPDEDLDALAGHVRELAVEGLATHLFLDGRSEGEALDEARARLTPGPVLPEVAEPAPSEAVLARGRQVYRSHCVACHGEDGTGRDEPQFDEDGSLNWPRDFTAGFLKGEPSSSALGWRIQAGLPGSAMPATDLGASDLQDLVAYVQSLIPAEAQTNRVHRRERIVAHRVAELPDTPDDARWEDLRETHVVLAPLTASRTGRAVTHAYVAARHDGEHLAVRVRWLDESANLRIFSDLAEPDACALQFTTDESPRLFGMGSREHRTNIWHWKAIRLTEVAGALDLLERVPHVITEPFRGRVRTDVPLYRPSASLPAVSTTVDSREASGVGRLGEDLDASALEVRPQWADGAWSVVFTRPCTPSAEGEVAARPGTRLNVALAVWNGAVADRGPRKSISIWQVFELER